MQRIGQSLVPRPRPEGFRRFLQNWEGSNLSVAFFLEEVLVVYFFLKLEKKLHYSDCVWFWLSLCIVLSALFCGDCFQQQSV